MTVSQRESLMHIHHLNCGILHAPPNPQAACHCLLLEHSGRLVLVDTGIGLRDIAQPQQRIGQPVIDAAGFQFHESLTAVRQIERLGYQLTDVTDIILTHADPDHAGGLADFLDAAVHVSAEELANLGSGNPRYSLAQFDHQPRWSTQAASDSRWFGLACRRLAWSIPIDVRLISLFGHTRGHCGVAIQHDDRWLLHVGDAYYLRVELATDDHPVSQLAALRADDDPARRKSLTELRRLSRDHAAEITFCGYHDFGEFPGG